MNAIQRVLLPAAALLALPAVGAEAKVPLNVQFPVRTFRGTPTPIGLTDYDRAPDRAPTLSVPPQTALLSRGKPVSASDENPTVGELTYVTDGDKTGIDGTIVELGPGVQWVQIDLGAPVAINAIAVWRYHADLRVYHAVVVQVSHDPRFSGKVTTVFNNDHDNLLKRGAGKDRQYSESNYGRLIDAKGAVGRYVRLYSNGNTSDDLNQYCEVEVFGERPRTPLAGSP